MAKTPAELEALEWLWAFWARPGQTEPPGDWTAWLILAGRGYGKTRTAAEWARAQAERMPGSRGALVARTAADTRDVLVEGESGILAVSPPRFMPVYEPSKRRVTWPNGSVATLYSADKPDLLRGPQHHWAIADELCLVAGTRVATARGAIAIENIRSGDMIFTRAGLRRVKHAGCTSTSATVYRMMTSDGRELVGTAGHPIWVKDKGFVPLRLLQYGDILMAWDITRRKSNQVLCGMVNGGGSTADTTWIGAGDCCIGPFTPFIVAPFQMGLTSIISTATKLILTFRTWKRCHVRSILGGIGLKDGVQKTTGSVQKLGLPCGRIGSRIRLSARSAALNLFPAAHERNFVRVTAKRHIGGKTRSNALQFHVSSAESHSCSTNPISAIALPSVLMPQNGKTEAHARFAESHSMQETPALSVVRKNAVTYIAPSVVSVEKLPTPQPVYNLEVEGEHEYFANGILTHNCAWRYPITWDMLMMGLRLGDHPRVLIATTPRPTKIIRELLKDPTTAVTRGSTYENRSNLAPAFFRQIIRRYENTRLGRQELYAEVLDDVPGALWNRDILDDGRVGHAPALARIVVAIDPATTALDESNETGIIVAGIDEQEHGYVLEDGSMRGSPAQWAEAAVRLYDRWQADRVIAETNQGGDMVEHTVRTAARELAEKGERTSRNVAFTQVRASRGKHTRAEPVSALYEQKRIHHVGMFAELEDEMCTWVPGEDSPDRCFVAGTMIATEYGEKPIEQIRVGDKVLTRSGSKLVIASGQTSYFSPVLQLMLSCGIILECTRNHPVFVPGKGFVEAWKLENGDPVLVLASKVSNSMGMNFDGIQTVAARVRRDTSIRFSMAVEHAVSRRFIEKFGSSTRTRSPMGGKFITRTEILGIMRSKISNLCRLKNMRKNKTNSIQTNLRHGEKRIWITLDHSQQNGIRARKGVSGTASMARTRGRTGSLQNESVLSAARNISHMARVQLINSALELVSVDSMNVLAGITKIGPVLSAETPSTSRSRRSNRLVRASVRGLSDAGGQAVYNLTVEGAHEYFANGVLVHNCDAAVWAFTELMTIDQTVEYAPSIWG